MAYNWVREVNDSHSSDKLVYLCVLAASASVTVLVELGTYLTWLIDVCDRDLTNNSVSSFTAEYPSLQEL